MGIGVENDRRSWGSRSLEAREVSASVSLLLLFPPVGLGSWLAAVAPGLSCGPELAAGLALGVGFVRSGAVPSLAPFDAALSSSGEH